MAGSRNGARGVSLLVEDKAQVGACPPPSLHLKPSNPTPEVVLADRDVIRLSFKTTNSREQQRLFQSESERSARAGSTRGGSRDVGPARLHIFQYEQQRATSASDSIHLCDERGGPASVVQRLQRQTNVEGFVGERQVLANAWNETGSCCEAREFWGKVPPVNGHPLNTRVQRDILSRLI